MSDYQPAIALVLENEGSAYREQDYGRGPSKYGITLKTMQELSPPGTIVTASDIFDLNPESAGNFYRMYFWNKHYIYNIDDQLVANKVMDLAVLDGPETSVMWLQNAVGSTPDGLLGPDTLRKIRAIPDQSVVLQRIRAQAEAHYQQVVSQHPEKQKELKGWLARLAKVNASTPTSSRP